MIVVIFTDTEYDNYTYGPFQTTDEAFEWCQKEARRFTEEYAENGYEYGEEDCCTWAGRDSSGDWFTWEVHTLNDPAKGSFS